LRIQHWFADPQNNTAVSEIAGRLVKAPPERLRWVFTKTDAFHDPNMLPDLAALQSNVDMTAELGYVKASFDVKQYSDLSMVKEAAQRLK